MSGCPSTSLVTQPLANSLWMTTVGGRCGGLSSERCSDARLTPEATLPVETTRDDYSCGVRNSSGSECGSSCVRGRENRHLHVLHDGAGGEARGGGGGERRKDGERAGEHADGEVEEEGGDAHDVDGHCGRGGGKKDRSRRERS